MSNRAQVYMKDEGIYLYQHCDGNMLMDKVVKAVQSPAGKSRQDDPEYLARIIFCEMVRGNEEGSTGYGIGTKKHGDIIEYLVTVDCENKTITEKKIYSKKTRVIGFRA